MTVEGVLQKVVTAAPIPVGLQLYHGLAETFRILLVTDSEKEELDYWLRLENLNKHSAIVYNDEYFKQLTPLQRRLKQVNNLRNRGYAIDLVLEPDPAVASQLLRGGFSVLNLLHFAYAIPDWRPDYEAQVKPWEELEAQVTSDQLLRQQDKRLDREE